MPTRPTSRGETETSPALESRFHQVLGMRELQAGVRKDIEEEAIALSEDDADAVVREGLDAGDLAEVTLEVGGSAHLAVDLVAVEGEVEPELDVLGGEGRAVVPEDVVAEGEGPLGEGWVDGPRGGEVRAGDVEVAAAAHDEVAGAEEGAADVVEGDAAGAHGVKAGGRVTAVGKDEDAAVGAVGGQGLGGWGGERRDGCRCAGDGGGEGRRCGRGLGGAGGDGGILGGAGRREAREGEGEGEEDGGSELHGTIVVGVARSVHTPGAVISYNYSTKRRSRQRDTSMTSRLLSSFTQLQILYQLHPLSRAGLQPRAPATL